MEKPGLSKFVILATLLIISVAGINGEGDTTSFISTQSNITPQCGRVNLCYRNICPAPSCNVKEECNDYCGTVQYADCLEGRCCCYV